MITSRDNKWLKAFRAALHGKGPETLHADGCSSTPDSGELIGVEGPKLVLQAIEAGLKAEALLVAESSEREAEAILRMAANSDDGIAQSRIFRTTEKLFGSVTATETPQGVAALFRQRIWGLEDVLRGPAEVRDAPALAVVLAAVQDPGNVGTIIRSAEAFGATGIVTTRGSADPWSPKALRASAGSALRLPVIRGMAVPILLEQLRIAGVKIYAASAHQEKDAVNGSGASAAPGKQVARAETDLSQPCAIFIGNEGAGVPPEVEQTADARISIATQSVESLNAAVAASIVLYEAARQRQEQMLQWH